MMMTETTETTTFLPFPVIATDANGFITDYNPYVQDLRCAIEIGTRLSDVFEHLHTNDHYQLVVVQDVKYLLVSKEMSSNYHINIAIDGSAYYDLVAKVRELDRSNRELDAIIETSYDGIYITDNEGQTLKTNSAIERLTGIPKHYYIGKSITELMDRGILKESVTTKVLEKKETVSLVQKNHNQKETLLTGSPIFNERGEIEKVVTNVRDLSDLNTLHEELNKVQKLNERYKHELDKLKAHTQQDPDVILNSKEMNELFNMGERLANVDTTILILGETGVGKDVFARHLYRVSNRYDKGKFIKVNCGAIPKDLLESELFGYESGAFSGASRSGKPGMFELADGGILFLDEVGEMPISLQVKLLRVLQEKEIQRVGGTNMKKVDVRVIAATNQDLNKMVKEGEFREDLYYRLHVVPVRIPSLRERKDDILPLAQYFLDQCNKKYSISKSTSRELKEFFYYHKWSGNVRELSNLVERMALTIPAKVLDIQDLPEEYQKESGPTPPPSSETTTLKEAVEHAEKQLLSSAMLKSSTTYEMAKQLGTSQATIVRKLQKYNLSNEVV